MRKLLGGTNWTKRLCHAVVYTAVGASLLGSVGCLSNFDPDAGQDVPGQNGQDGNDGKDGDNGQNGINCWDLNGDGIDDPDEDKNQDGVFDALDCQAQPDRDFDGVPDLDDNCPDEFNPDQLDDDGDTVGDACDQCPGEDDLLDSDGDGVPDCFVRAEKLLLVDPPDVIDPAAVVSFTFDITDGTGHVWDLTDEGEVSDGENPVLGTSDAYDTFHTLEIDGNRFPAQTDADLEDEREVVYGPETMSGLTVTRKVYVPEEEGFARWLDIIANDTAAAITFDVEIDGNLGSDESNPFVFESTNGDLLMDIDDTWWVNCQDAGDDPCTGGFAPGAFISKSDDDLLYQYSTMTLQPGERVIIVTFAAMRSFDPSSFGSLDGPVEQLAALMKEVESFPAVEEKFLAGMSAAELADVFHVGGTHVIRGVAGSVSPNEFVVITNTDTSEERTVRADDKGAWQAAISGQPGDIVEYSATDGTGGLLTLD